MRNIVIGGVAAAFIVSGCTQAPSPSLATREERFLNFVQAIADSGRLSDREEMARLLQIRLVEKPAPRSGALNAYECRQTPNAQRLYNIQKYIVGDKFWFKRSNNDKRTSQAVPDLSSPVTRMFEYSVTYGQRCSEDPATAPHVSANVQFYDVPAFVCVSGTNLARLMPQAKFVPATDGATVYSAPSKDPKTYITIVFLFSGDCASIIRIDEQS